MGGVKAILIFNNSMSCTKQPLSKALKFLYKEFLYSFKFNHNRF
ncbi:hypothetical protein BVAVS116_D0009 (plasmid) [Borreliella valaisiana VS116]|uniref:Uncharacterized protein n=1 Tax=Borreliella valaisiana VS116 TaxID=445987 RepID=C0R8W4_BORVA|nr:hypothetical protein BVAVS116_D0009 [Borreliella valaisiana VS116]